LVMLHAYGLFSPEYVAITVSSLLLQLNNCINPVFYAFLSPRVRQYLCWCCVRCRPNNQKEASSSTPNATACSTIQTTSFSSFQQKS
jgi:hypothetical protein